MKIALITPARPGAHNGNRNTATRWARLLKEDGHQVKVQFEWNGEHVDLMLALHARRSYPSIARFSEAQPHKPLVVVLTGTDLYRDIQTDRHARHSLALATRLVVLQDQGLVQLAPSLRGKTRVVYQSAQTPPSVTQASRFFQVCVIGHLREEKDPLRCALALRHVPTASRIRVIQVGRALQPELAVRARELMNRLSAYRWLDGLPHWAARRKLAQSHLMVISSRMEGGANVIAEAVQCRVPVLASRIPGNVGMLGADYHGYFALGDERALATLLWRAESGSAYYQLLQQQCAARRHLFEPRSEAQALATLLSELESAPA
ncbi:MAG: selenoneine biosynthesis selenosugar synthase SenB [Burkholderiales bacterium]